MRTKVTMRTKKSVKNKCSYAKLLSIFLYFLYFAYVAYVAYDICPAYKVRTQSLYAKFQNVKPLT